MRYKCVGQLGLAIFPFVVVVITVEVEMNALIIPSIEKQSPSNHSILQTIFKHISDNIGENISLDDLAMETGESKFKLSRVFQKYFGSSPVKWMWQYRARLALEIIGMNTGMSLIEVSTLCGFNNPPHFSRLFKEVFGESPSETLKRVELSSEKNEHLRITLYENLEEICFQSLKTHVLSCVTD